MAKTIKQTNSIDLLARKLITVGDPSRLKIICLIFNNKKICVTDIANKLDMSVACVSHHLQSLVKEKLLESTREGKNICYNLSDSDLVSDLKKFICKYK